MIIRLSNCEHNLLSSKWNKSLLFIIFLSLIVIVLITYYISSSHTKKDFVPPITDILPKNRTLLQMQSSECIVNVEKRDGRLGNRMFIVATAYGLARLHSCRLHITLDILNELKSVFILDLSSLLISTSTYISMRDNISRPMHYFSKEVQCDYVFELIRPNGIPFGSIFEPIGYWQSYLHFVRYGDELRKHVFAASQTTLEKVSKVFVEIYYEITGMRRQFSIENHQIFKKQLAEDNQITWIGIHVRRGDFISLNFTSSPKYLIDAIQYYMIRYPNAHFIVASDDKAYCKDLFREQSHVFITPTTFSFGDDLITLSLCQHSIVTAGTFGWWTGYLANGEVIHDNVYISGCEKRAYYYPPWYLINGHVRGSRRMQFIPE
ncbi:unnamed protein product [Adineta ricciae]|uniref:L-Fucosyltransferase n=1 Tax=Adineta ricciae TaxID=249248 RepID=A0A815SZ66_ADIRI|nr:unnamed protein product [Adineta ricciae]CAF1568782.1 unnamed protein product [Adineta ricciae]